MIAINLKFCTQAAVAIIVSATLFSATAAPKKCTREDAMKAEVNSSSLETWRELYVHYRLYKQCDDGAISEGYSASVADLLTTRWNGIGEFIKLSNDHPDFKNFVLRHIDETMSQDQARAIKFNIKNNCPTGGKYICHFINDRFAEPGVK